MAFTVKGKKSSGATALIHVLHLLANSEGSLTNFVDNADADQLGSRSVRIEYLIRVSTANAPTSNAPLMFYLVTADDELTKHLDGDGAITFSAVAATEFTSGTTPTADKLRFKLGPAVHARPVDSSTGEKYYGSFVMDITGARHWAIYVYNGTGQALDGDNSDHYLRYIYDDPDIR